MTYYQMYQRMNSKDQVEKQNILLHDSLEHYPVVIASDNRVLTIDSFLLTLCGSVGGAVLLVVGLYCVLWGKNREDGKSVTNEQRQESKEEIVLECITHH